MEGNNGRINEPINDNISLENLKEENIKLRKYLNDAIEEIKNLRNTWDLQRINFLIEIVKCNEFNTELKSKAVEEIEYFIYPKDSKENNNTDNHEE